MILRLAQDHGEYNRTMKIFFAGSIRGGRGDMALYAKIIGLLSKYGQVLTEHIGDQKLTIMGEAGVTRAIRERDITWLNESDVIVAEVTSPSLGVGYEIAKAEDMGKKILCFYRSVEGRSISAMISGSDKLVLKKYKTISDIKRIFEEYCRKAGIVLE